MFWAYGNFSQLELLCVNSFVKQNYDVSVWSYDLIENLPTGASLRDANEILPEEGVFTYKNGSVAAFANLFRYTLLMQHGGLYVDTDVIALRDAALIPEHPFLVTERTTTANALKINNNVIHCPHPAPGCIIDLAQAMASRFPIEQMEWGDTGPKLLTVLHQAYPRLSYPLMPPEFANPINWWNCPETLLNSECAVPKEATFLHCFNQIWRQKGVEKNNPFPSGSMMALLTQQFLNT